MRLVYTFVCFILFVIGLPLHARAQDTLMVALPDIYITADRIMQGDGDTYGLGDWNCVFTLALEDSLLLLKGRVVFEENANDHTRITGRYEGYWGLSILNKYKSCRVKLGLSSGSVSGQNFGARGYRRFRGQGLIRSARVRCDVLGMDAGHIGAGVHFAPVILKLDCAIAENTSTDSR